MKCDTFQVKSQYTCETSGTINSLANALKNSCCIINITAYCKLRKRSFRANMHTERIFASACIRRVHACIQLFTDANHAVIKLLTNEYIDDDGQPAQLQSLINSLRSADNLCSLDQDQARENDGPDQDHNCLTL